VESRRFARLGTCSTFRCTPACAIWFRDLNSLYRSNPALHQVDFEPAGFEWMAPDDAE
jgi:1,4-alpha-glucan branching enzyme